MKQKAREELNLKRIRKALYRLLMDWGWRPYSPEWKPGVILGLSYVYGNDPDVLARVSLQDRKLCASVIAQCRKNGIWRGDSVRCRAHHKENSAFAFLLDAMVAGGIISRQSVSGDVIKERRSKREQRVSAGLCANCGKSNDSEKRTCQACRESVKRSAAKKITRVASGDFTPKVVDSNPYYFLNDEQRKQVRG